ncbi:CheY chemotaxis protein or a CheY-like REC (receiver) domain [Paracoccus chinensis]|uniref:CheY chemotaxis protein or a CheY-like REC (Receiver) domain n=2 Tax=Paracoccus chinensis TaxID=525640 RepID=A0A1G9MM86_9RHOB|nr:CheY chemotaxis protein or a CheY-like REC (receiver) domain [Paracoccus chinensis]
MLAADLRDQLEREGAEVLGPAPSVARALLLLANDPPPSMAFLDINLQGEMAWPVADRLRELGVPFVFATGYEAAAIPSAYAAVPRAEKPVSVRNLRLAAQG